MTNQYLNLLSRLWVHLTRRRRTQFLLVLGLSGMSALTEMVGLGLVFPFLTVLVSPEKVIAIPAIVKLKYFLGIDSTDALLFSLTIALVSATVIACIVRLLLLWANAQVSNSIGGELSLELYRRTLFQPYIIHIERNSSEIIAGIVTKASHATSFLLQTGIFLSSSLVLITLSFTLVVIDPQVALSTVIIFGTIYILISHIVKKSLRNNGEILSYEAPRIVKALQEGLGGIRDVLLDGTQSHYCDLYAYSDRRIRRAQSENHIINMFPKYLIEALAVTVISILAYQLNQEGSAFQSAIPVLGVLALGSQRILPTLNLAYAAWANILTTLSSVSDTLALLDQPLPPEAFDHVSEQFNLTNYIRLESVDFKYQSTGKLILKSIDLTIKKGERIGIIGLTGSGKSTFLNILMGLMPPSSGRLVVDGITITKKNSHSWRKTIAHVPQNIFLADASIAENIALGMPLQDIDMDKVRRVAERAQIADIIESRPGGYTARVGESGLKFSGGQRQRIAIARALYKSASVIVLDEATSSLDDITEEEVTSTMRNLGRELTIITVAHRIGSLRDCDRIFRIKSGILQLEIF